MRGIQSGQGSSRRCATAERNHPHRHGLLAGEDGGGGCLLVHAFGVAGAWGDGGDGDTGGWEEGGDAQPGQGWLVVGSGARAYIHRF